VSNPPPGNPSDSTIDKVTLGMIVSSLQRRQEKKSRQAHGQQQTQGGKDAPERVRLVFQIDPLLLGRLQVQADRLGLTLSQPGSDKATGIRRSRRSRHRQEEETQSAEEARSRSLNPNRHRPPDFCGDAASLSVRKIVSSCARIRFNPLGTSSGSRQ
jgi:hypothetical protein